MKILGVILGILGVAWLILVFYAGAFKPIAKFEYKDYMPGMTFCLMSVYFFVSGFRRRLQIRDLFVLVTVCAALFGWMRWENSRYSDEGLNWGGPPLDLDPPAVGTNSNNGSPPSSEKPLQGP